MKKNKLLLSLIMAGVVSVASASKENQPQRSLLEGSQTNSGNTQFQGAGAASSVVLDFSLANGESWDLLDDPDNMVLNCVMGGAITGFEWTDLTIETVGASWLSETVLQFSDSTGSASADLVYLTPGVDDGNPGVGVYSSGGVVDFTDNGLSDIVALADGQLPIQIFESFDDVADTIDNNITSGTLELVGVDLWVPSGCPVAAATQSDVSVSVVNNSAGMELDFGDLVTVSVTVTNNGPGVATNVAAVASYPDTLVYSSNNCGATDNGTSVAWDVGSLANGGSAVCDVTFSVDGYGVSSVGASVTADQADNATGNNSGGVGVNGPARIIPTLGQYGMMLMILALLFVSRRKFAK